MTRLRALLATALLSSAAVVATCTFATPITFTGSSGSLSASVTFTVVGSNLSVVLSNTGAADALVPTDVLEALFFNVTGSPSLSAVSATSGGATYTVNPQVQVSAAGTDIGGGWAFNQGISAHGASYGIGAAGFGVFGPGNLFPGATPSGADSPGPGGLAYGLLPTGDDLATGNGGMQGRPLTRNSDTFLLNLGALAANFNPATAISGVTFQYGTSLTETSFSARPAPLPATVPEPATLALLGLGLAGLGAVRRKCG